MKLNTKLFINSTKFLLLLVFIVGCERKKTMPIETYGGSKYVVVNYEITPLNVRNLQLKNKDTIFWVTVLTFDCKNINIGDTIR
jgi:hypothetical protein